MFNEILSKEVKMRHQSMVYDVLHLIGKWPHHFELFTVVLMYNLLFYE